MNTIKKITKGYITALNENRSAFLAPFKIVGFLGVIVGISFGIVYPLWLFATNDKELYSNFVIIFILTGVALFIIYRAVRYIYFFGFKRFITTIIFPNLFKLLKIIFGIAYIGGAAYFFSVNIIISIALIIIAIVVIGYFRFVYKKS